ncbi:HK97 family phage prohead protease [Phyllobacterium leguminum]|uniref:Prohead serine protease n=1 Tax=Phyllobacterium leguminum TaxID=314237 RepID=A0A318SXX4_9HYPH|nr:HK97 family phage prohead protease [Phyllobacterium leguminum]PYE86902.1 prohead serine protease [Phyllobacterium leguminum]
MPTEIKSLTVKDMDDAGRGQARIAVLSAVDHDGDTYMPGAFSWKEGGQWVSILPAHNRSAVPLGKARVYEDGDAALADLYLNMKSEVGREWHSTLKFDLENGNPVQEWSYGFGVLDSQIEQRSGDRVRVLKRLDVHEISPVVRGAGMGTGTLTMKSRGSFAERIEAVLAEIDDIIERAGDIKGLREAQGREMSKARLDQLTELKNRLDAMLAAGASGNQPDRQAQEEAERLAAEFHTREARSRLRL